MRDTRPGSVESNAQYHRTQDGTFRSFGGKRFLFHNTYETKERAQRDADTLRKEGFITKIIAVDRGYIHTWIRTGEKVHKKNYQLFIRLREKPFGKA
jgi:hypothetical protein